MTALPDVRETGFAGPASARAEREDGGPAPSTQRRDSRPAVALSTVTKVYGHGAAGVAALEDVSLSIEPGEFLCLVGASGCGKSTLLNLVAGLDRPTAGTVTVGGSRIDTLGEAASAKYRRATIGLVFQFFNLLDDLTVLDNVVLPAQLAGAARAETTHRATATR